MQLEKFPHSDERCSMTHELPTLTPPPKAAPDPVADRELMCSLTHREVGTVADVAALEGMTPAEVHRQVTRCRPVNGLSYFFRGGHGKNPKPVIVTYADGRRMKYISGGEAARALGVSQTRVSNAVRRRVPIVGCRIKFAEET
jgi:hypothetical protein